jgi:hypothetical protein
MAELQTENNKTVRILFTLTQQIIPNHCDGMPVKLRYATNSTYQVKSCYIMKQGNKGKWTSMLSTWELPGGFVHFYTVRHFHYTYVPAGALTLKILRYIQSLFQHNTF